jgi:hypothetical protein
VSGRTAADRTSEATFSSIALALSACLSLTRCEKRKTKAFVMRGEQLALGTRGEEDAAGRGDGWEEVGGEAAAGSREVEGRRAQRQGWPSASVGSSQSSALEAVAH